MPFAATAPPVVLTVVNWILSGVRALADAPSISTAISFVVVIVPEAIVIKPAAVVPSVSVAKRPRSPESGVIVSEPKVVAPALLVRKMPVPMSSPFALPDPVTLVLAKLTAAVELFTVIPVPVEFATVVAVPPPLTVKLPEMSWRKRPSAELFVELILVSVILSGVRPAGPSMNTAAAPVVVTVPDAEVMVPVLF